MHARSNRRHPKVAESGVEGAQRRIAPSGVHLKGRKEPVSAPRPRECICATISRPAPSSTGRPPLSGSKQPTQPTTRKERRAAERQQDRFEAERSDRKTRTGAPKKGGSSLINAKTMTLAAIVIGVLIVAFVGYQQLSGTVGGQLKDPGIAYPASIQHDNTLGSAGSPVTLEVYGDFQCPYCAESSLNSEPAIVSKYVIPGKVQLIHHDFEWIGNNTPNRESRLAAAGGICAVKQGKYWDYAHWAFANQIGENVGSFTRDRLIRIATAAGLDPTDFGTCIDSADVLAQVDANTAEFTPIVSAHGGTPMFFINGTFAGAGYKTADQLGTLIDAALNGGSPAPSSSASSSASPAASGSSTP
jgi:protein-disulfide isomerase